MIKKLFLTAALLLPGIAHAGNPSANLPVQIVPARPAGSCGTPLGDAAVDAAAAGFTTCALYNDFTTQIPNNVGTGLAQGWLDCSGNSSPGAIWNWQGFFTANSLPCVSGSGANSANSAVFQAPDPLFPNDGLVLHLQASDPSDSAFLAGGGIAANQFPDSYTEFVFRTDTGNGMYSGVTYWYAVLAGLPDGDLGLEWDLSECYGCDHWDAGILIHDSPNAGNPLPNPSGDQYWNAQFSQYPDTQYHTVGGLITSDGSTGFSACSYWDGTKVGCGGPFPYPIAAMYNQRLWMQIGIGQKSAGLGTNTYYLRSVKVYTCANWRDLSTNGECTSP